jgi:hypothetical protein
MNYHNRITLTLTLIVCALWSCHSSQTTGQLSTEQKELQDSVYVDAGNASIIKTDTIKKEPKLIVLKESDNEEDIPTNEAFLEKLKPIRENFKRINSISKWTTVNKKNIPEETAIATFYYSIVVLRHQMNFYYQNKKGYRHIFKNC